MEKWEVCRQGVCPKDKEIGELKKQLGNAIDSENLLRYKVSPQHVEIGQMKDEVYKAINTENSLRNIILKSGDSEKIFRLHEKLAQCEIFKKGLRNVIESRNNKIDELNSQLKTALESEASLANQVESLQAELKKRDRRVEPGISPLEKMLSKNTTSLDEGLGRIVDSVTMVIEIVKSFGDAQILHDLYDARASLDRSLTAINKMLAVK
jgi:chromosome segregation ATPase